MILGSDFQVLSVQIWEPGRSLPNPISQAPSAAQIFATTATLDRGVTGFEIVMTSRSTSRQAAAGLLDMPGGPASVVAFMVYGCVLVIGAYQATHYMHTGDTMSDPTYPDLARSLLQQGSYQVAFWPQTTLPPGWPLILAAVGAVFGFSQAVLYRVVAVATVFGLIAAYELLRRAQGRGVAAAACLLLACSPSMFAFNTAVIYPEMPYLLASMVVLLLAYKIDRTNPAKGSIAWVLILSVVLASAVLIRSVGVALLVGLVTWGGASLLFAQESGRRRIRMFCIPLLVGLVAQVGWSAWARKHQVLQWQLPGYPESYISQLKVKNGQYPELGTAHLSDIPRRVGRNIVMQTAGFSQFLLRRNISRFWSSPAVFAVLLLIAVGLFSSFQNGGQLHDWYFLWYEFIYIVWPWDFRERFLLPVLPLTCLYLWRGGTVFRNLSLRRPGAFGAGLVLVGSVLCICSAAFALRIVAFPVNPEHVRGDHLQTVAAALFWSAVAAVGVAMVRHDAVRRWQDSAGLLARLSRSAESSAPPLLRLAAVSGIVFLVISATTALVAIGRYNMNPDITRLDHYPEFEAANWIRTHEPSNLIVMDREPEFVSHFTNRQVVWFPPISDPKILMDGIRRHHVGVIVVAHHADSYWLPAEDDCFQGLLQAYGSAFRLSHQGPDNWVYEVVPSSNGS